MGEALTFEEFQVGEVFYTGSGAWVCTDKGSRVVVAMRKRQFERYPEGPPYSVAEDVFDEYDQEGCSQNPLEFPPPPGK